MAQEGNEWEFIPPRSPHFGGIWEAAVKSTKYHLKRVAANASLTFEEMHKLLAQIESCLNSRSLTPMSSDPNDLTFLTPGHFLIGDSFNSLPEPDITLIKSNKLSHWQRVQQLFQHFWNRWSTEYTTQLQRKSKWYQQHPNLEPGSMVLLREESLPPLQWKMGRVVEVHAGGDGVVRVASVKTINGVVKRAITKLCLLPIEVDNVSDGDGTK